MADKRMVYTEPKARRARRLAKNEDYQKPDGSPNPLAIARAVGLSAEVTEWLLDPANQPKPDRRFNEQTGRYEDIDNSDAAEPTTEEPTEEQPTGRRGRR